MATAAPDFTDLVARLNAAVQEAPDPVAVTRRVKQELETLLHDDGLRLPERFRQARPDGYARRLLHRDPDGRYTAVVMTWDVGQGTPLHDHAGIWCVEGVVEGRMVVRQFDLVDDTPGACRFVARDAVSATVGTAGCLIPPFEYHTLANASTAGPSITLHIYGGEMDRCHIFAPRPDGCYERQTKELGYTD
ncbi:MAG TPA: cysteine dioxygenase family protein [Vicinamibacterales bacterium]|nr:cysteine dioxygenase family protein [Vicinamibacterales bacterium]